MYAEWKEDNVYEIKIKMFLFLITHVSCVNNIATRSLEQATNYENNYAKSVRLFMNSFLVIIMMHIKITTPTYQGIKHVIN